MFKIEYFGIKQNCVLKMNEITITDIEMIFEMRILFKVLSLSGGIDTHVTYIWICLDVWNKSLRKPYLHFYIFWVFHQKTPLWLCKRGFQDHSWRTLGSVQKRSFLRPLLYSPNGSLGLEKILYIASLNDFIPLLEVPCLN